MPSMGDSIVIFLLALILFGPKKLPQLARQLGKLMAEFRKASNDFRMQMEDELRIEEQKDHQAKVDALAPPPSSVPNPDIPTEDPPHPHLPAPSGEAGHDAINAGEPAPQPIAESGDLKMMPPTTGLPTESAARNRSSSQAAAGTDGQSHSDVQHEHSIGGTALSTHSNGDYSATGMSSDEPAEETALIDYPPPDRSQPVVVGEAERATHV